MKARPTYWDLAAKKGILAANFNRPSFEKKSVFDFLAFITACSKEFGDITVCCRTAAAFHSRHVRSDHRTAFYTNLLGLHSTLGSRR